MENTARAYYETFLLSGGEIGRAYLKLTQKLTPLRVACAGGRIPLDDNSGAGNNEEDDGSGDDDEPKKRKKKVQAFSDFSFTSKLNTLIKELQDIRAKDKMGEFLASLSARVITLVSSLTL